MHESTGKSITVYNSIDYKITNNIFYMSDNVTIVTEKVMLVIQFQFFYWKEWSRSNDL